MIVDTSALVAILRAEPEAPAFARALRGARRKLLAAPSYLEAGMVIVGRKSLVGKYALDRLIAETGMEIVSFERATAEIAIDAFARFGKGRHPAQLNFGDCISYALAKLERMPLLFKCDDFRHSDIEAAI